MVFPLEIGDLSTTSPWRRRSALARPFAGVTVFAITVHFGWWWLTPLVMFAIFVAVVTVTHDVVHRSLGRAWLAIEAAVPILALTVGLLSLTSFPGILVYVTMAIAGSWVYPLLTADVELPLGGSAVSAARRGNSISDYLPHHDYGDTPLSQTRTLRGRLLPAVFLELTYHLPELGRRLDPYFAANGVKPVRVP